MSFIWNNTWNTLISPKDLCAFSLLYNILTCAVPLDWRFTTSSPDNMTGLSTPRLKDWMNLNLFCHFDRREIYITNWKRRTDGGKLLSLTWLHCGQVCDGCDITHSGRVKSGRRIDDSLALHSHWYSDRLLLQEQASCCSLNFFLGDIWIALTNPQTLKGGWSVFWLKFHKSLSK